MRLFIPTAFQSSNRESTISIDGKTKSIEVNLFDFKDDLYGKKLKISIVKKMRDEIKFNKPGDYALYYEYFIRSETYIGAHYLSNFDQRINYYLLDPKKYLYDNSEKYYETKELSDQLTPLVFKSFPKEGIDLEWYKYNWETYPYESQRNRFGERWHEDNL